MATTRVTAVRKIYSIEQCSRLTVWLDIDPAIEEVEDGTLSAEDAVLVALATKGLMD